MAGDERVKQALPCKFHLQEDMESPPRRVLEGRKAASSTLSLSLLVGGVLNRGRDLFAAVCEKIDTCALTARGVADQEAARIAGRALLRRIAFDGGTREECVVVGKIGSWHCCSGHEAGQHRGGNCELCDLHIFCGWGFFLFGFFKDV